jgi:hypothetical protein
MAPSPSLLPIFFMITVPFFSLLPHAAKLPFHPSDVLTLLPRQASWHILNSLYSPVDLLPSFVGAASSPNDTLEWKGACFYKNRAWMEFHNKSGTEFGGGTLHIMVWNLSLLACFLLFCWILECWVSGHCSWILLMSGIELGFFFFFFFFWFFLLVLFEFSWFCCNLEYWVSEFGSGTLRINLFN